MQTFAIIGFTFGVIAFTMVGKLTKEVKDLREELEAMKKRLPPVQ